MSAKLEAQRCPHCGAALILLGPKTRDAVAKRLIGRLALLPDKIWADDRDPDDVSYALWRVPETNWRIMTAWHPGELLTAVEVTRATRRRDGTLYPLLANGRFPGAYMDGPNWNVPRHSVWRYWFRAPEYTLSRKARSVRRNATLAKIEKKRAAERA